MKKKDNIRMHCQICNRTTTHEIRSVDGQEISVCLVCESSPQNKAELNAMEKVIREGEITMFSGPHYG